MITVHENTTLGRLKDGPEATCDGTPQVVHGRDGRLREVWDESVQHPDAKAVYVGEEFAMFTCPACLQGRTFTKEELA